jgi:hypothetical protein
VTARTARRHHGVLAHRSRTLTRADTTRRYGIPVTTPQRTLQDLARVLDPASLTRSVLEDAYLGFIDRHGLPRPEVNQIVAGYEVDMLWRPQLLIAELDGRAYHEDTFEEDREREAARFRALLA